MYKYLESDLMRYFSILKENSGVGLQGFEFELSASVINYNFVKNSKIFIIAIILNKT